MSWERQKEQVLTPRPKINKIFRGKRKEEIYELVDFGKKEIWKEIIDIATKSDDPPHCAKKESSSSWESTNPFRFTDEESESSDDSNPFRFTDEESKSSDDSSLFHFTDESESSDDSNLFRFTGKESESHDDSDIFRFTSEESTSSDNSGDTTVKNFFRNLSTEDARSSDSISSSPETMRYTGNFHSEEELSPVIFPKRGSDLQFDAPKLTSTRLQYSGESDIHFGPPVVESTKIGNLSKSRETAIDSISSKLGNTLPIIPLKIDETYFNSPDGPDFEAANVENADFLDLDSKFDAQKLTSTQVKHSNESDIHFGPPVVESTKLGDVNISVEDLKELRDATLVKRKNQEYEAFNVKCSTGKSPNVSPILLRCNYDIQQKQQFGKSEIFCITTINTQDIVDDVFKNTNDTSSPKFNDAIIDSKYISGDQFSQIKKEDGVNDMPKNASKKEHGIIKRKRQAQMEVSVRKKTGTRCTNPSGPISVKIGQLSDVECRKYKEYLKTIPVCDLSLEKTIISPQKDREISNGKRKAQKSGNRRKKQTSSSRSAVRVRKLNDEECRKYKEYLKTIPICDLSLKKTLDNRSITERYRDVKND